MKTLNQYLEESAVKRHVKAAAGNIAIGAGVGGAIHALSKKRKQKDLAKGKDRKQELKRRISKGAKIGAGVSAVGAAGEFAIKRALKSAIKKRR